MTYGMQMATMVALCGIIGLAGCERGPEASKASAPSGAGSSASNSSVQSGYAALARDLADQLMTDADGSQPAKELAQLLAEANLKIVRVQSIQSADPLVMRIAQEAVESGEAMIRSQQALDSLAQDDGFSSLAIGALGLYLGEPEAIVQGANGLLAQGDAVHQERIRWAAAFNRGRAAQLMLPDAARKYGGPRTDDPGVIGIDFDESWGGSADHDAIALTNMSGHSLTNCTVLVELHGGTGEVRQNVHFVDMWRPGSRLGAHYGIGVESDGVIYGRRTVHGVQDIRVSVWADEASLEDIPYRYPGAERDRDIKALLDEKLKFIADYRQVPFFGTGPAAYLILDGIGQLPAQRVTCTFHRRNANPPESLAFYWDRPEWPRGEKRPFDTNGGFNWAPESFDVAISFPDIGYVWQGSYILKAP